MEDDGRVTRDLVIVAVLTLAAIIVASWLLARRYSRALPPPPGSQPGPSQPAPAADAESSEDGAHDREG